MQIYQKLLQDPEISSYLANIPKIDHNSAIRKALIVGILSITSVSDMISTTYLKTPKKTLRSSTKSTSFVIPKQKTCRSSLPVSPSALKCFTTSHAHPKSSTHSKNLFQARRLKAPLIHLNLKNEFLAKILKTKPTSSMARKCSKEKFFKSVNRSYEEANDSRKRKTSSSSKFENENLSNACDYQYFTSSNEASLENLQ